MTDDHRQWKIGELAQQTGVSVRTLHHYDALGLLPAHRHPNSGHRWYGADQVRRLQHIRLLQALGLQLDDIKKLLDGHRPDLANLLEAYRQQFCQRIAQQQRMVHRLDQLLHQLQTRQTLSLQDVLTHIKEMMTMDDVTNHYSAEQLESLTQRGKEIGPKRIKEVEAEWGELIALADQFLQDGVAPESAPAQELGQRWLGLINEFTGGDPAMQKSLQSYNNANQEQLQSRHAHFPKPEHMEYIQKVFQCRSE